MSATTGEKQLYRTLCKVLDSLCAEAPESDNVYHPESGNDQGVIQARSRALLHLFLKAKFGLLTHAARDVFVTDGARDGGIDAYYIDERQKKIYILQSKFRANAENMVSTKITTDDLLKMDVSMILKGEKKAEDGNRYNEKITKHLQPAVSKIPDRGDYTTQVVIIGNVKNYSDSDLKKLIGEYSVDQYPHDRIYKELLFPVVNGTYFNQPNLTIEIILANTSGSACLDYEVKAESTKANVKLAFVPTKEIGRIMSVYKNSILKFNPRSYLGLESNEVNKDIESSIKNGKSNEFAVFNNGITIISNYTSYSSETGRRGAAQLSLRNPQLVNGGQTAYTLGRIYEECCAAGNFSVFSSKEVLLRVITFSGKAKDNIDEAKLKFIGEISKASNSQTHIGGGDRRANDDTQLKIQEIFFEKHGLYYERKLGEFSDGLRSQYISQHEIVDREEVLKIALAVEYRISQTRSSIGKHFDDETKLKNVLKESDIDKYAYGWKVLSLLNTEQKKTPSVKNDRYHTNKFGQAIRYGKYPVIAVCVDKAMEANSTPKAAVDSALRQWKTFEDWAAKRPTNSTYLNQGGGFNYVNYYKGATISQDLQDYPFSF